MLAANVDEVTLWIPNRGEVVVPLRRIQRVEFSAGKTRIKSSALIGAGVGAAVGLLMGTLQRSDCNAKGGWICDAYIPGMMILTTPAGALVGGILGSNEWHDYSPAGGRVGRGQRPPPAPFG